MKKKNKPKAKPYRKPKPQWSHDLPEPQMSDLDFDPAKALDAAMAGRGQVEGITIDPPRTHIIDDGLRVARYAVGWGISASIIDLPSIIPDGSRLEQLAAERLIEGKNGRRVQRIWPVAFLDNYASMRSGTVRPAITFKVTLDDDFNVVRSEIRRTIFANQGEYDRGSFQCYPDLTLEKAKQWRTLARGLYQKRSNRLSNKFDRALQADAPIVNVVPTHAAGRMKDGELLVHEVMRLTNRVATDYLEARNLAAPLRIQKTDIYPTCVTEDYGFDMDCNRICADLIDQMRVQFLPYVHLNSPLRSYRDYMALKVLGRALDGKDEDLHLRDEVLSLCDTFNAAAHGFVLAPKWMDEWSALLQQQAGWTPFSEGRCGPNNMGHVEKLKRTCEARQWDLPHVAERELSVQGVNLIFTGVNLRRDNKPDIHACAVSPKRGHAFDSAAQRLLAKLENV